MRLRREEAVERTCGDGVVSGGISSHCLLHDFVRGEVDCVRRSCRSWSGPMLPIFMCVCLRTCSYDHGRDSSPQRHTALGARYRRNGITDACVYRRRCRVDDLHPRLCCTISIVRASPRRLREVRAYLKQVDWVHHRVFLLPHQLQSSHAPASYTHSNAGECTGRHVGSQREVGR